MCLWSPLRAAGLLRLCVARPFRLPVSLLAGLVTLRADKKTIVDCGGKEKDGWKVVRD